MAEHPSINLTQPIFENITITLSPATGSPGRVARRRLTTALRQTLHRSVNGWRVRRVPGSSNLTYDLLPPTGQTLAVDEAWNLTYALAALPNIQDAEPSFALLQDVTPVIAPEVVPAIEARSLPPPAGAADDQAPATVDPALVDWSVRLVNAPGAWQLEPPPAPPGFSPGERRGKGIRIGHPDSGYRRHPDLFEEPPGALLRILTAIEKDFVDSNQPTVENTDGSHGLSTSGVIMSSDVTGRIVGIAPAAELVPLRVSKSRLGGLIPSPILFGSGARALRDAIRYAANEAQCHVISISLGWFANRSLHEALQEAVANNVIVCAAAGNYTGILVWPAAYPEAIAVAGCNAQRQIWSGSARGDKVAVSGPAENVWVAAFTAAGAPGQAQNSGTSFAVATVAGVAALWLAYHGRAALLQRYQGEFTLSDVFRFVLGRSSDPFAVPVGNNFGAGIVNARRVLQTPLPSLADLQTAMPAAVRALAVPVVMSPVAQIAAVFPHVPQAELRARLAALMNVPESELDTRLLGVEDEVIFHFVTDPALRTQLAIAEAAEATRGLTPIPASPTPSLAANPLSDRLRSRLGG